MADVPKNGISDATLYKSRPNTAGWGYDARKLKASGV
jgi:hypothetical protein